MKLKDVIICQLQFRKHVLGSKGPKENFQQVIKGKTFSLKELEANLLEIIEINSESEEQAHQSELLYRPIEEVCIQMQSEKFNMAQKLEKGRRKIMVSQQQCLLPTYIENPDLLVGKSVKHKFILPDSRERERFKGCVTRVVKKD